MTYFDWLVYIIAPDHTQRDDYIELLFALYSTEFFWVIPRDRNRAEDGLELRTKYEKETGEYVDIYGPCNCLELFVALAIRCENELMYNYNLGDRTSKWFWIFLDNLGLLEYDSEAFDFDKVDDILYHFMNRDYGPHGEFCAFPCKKSVSVLKKTELSYQINYFIKENYF